MILLPYSQQYQAIWDAFVESSRNGTFLFKRNYMGYHANRFLDASLLFFDKSTNVRPLALLPANFDKPGKCIVTHGGLTYGGMLLAPRTSYRQVHEMFVSALEYYRQLGAESLIYKPIPYIYHRYPCQEDLYWLHQNGARLSARSISSCVCLREPLTFSELRRRKMKSAEAGGIKICFDEEDFEGFWKILSDVLQKHHATKPVHSLEEINKLHEKFPREITLVVARNPENKLIAGTVLYHTKSCIHAQYIAASEKGRNSGALDLLFARVISHYKDAAEYFDFGISTEENGTILNEGLLFQKEGFGARGICYDRYELSIK